MRLMFVYYLMDDAGSAQDIHYYCEAAARLGHEIVVYGPPQAHTRFKLSRDLAAADAVVFIFEWTTMLRYGDPLDLVRLIETVPRRRRFVIDCDGAYNRPIRVNGDYNHRDEATSRKWMETCDCIADQVYQPTLHPQQPNVRPFFFHGYHPGWERPLDFRRKDYAMVYVGHSKFRWGPMERVLRAVEPLGAGAGRLAIVGHGWDAMPAWAKPMGIEDFFYTDKEYLRRLAVECVPPVSFDQVIDWMSKGRFSPVIYRPLFSHLRLVTCRTFETPAANTLPLFGLEESYVREIYGDEALELVLPTDQPSAKIQDMIDRPDHYGGIVDRIRQRLRREHSYEARLRQLLDIVSQPPAAKGGAACG